MRFCLLASGSSGNSTWVEEDGRAILIDNGLTLKNFRMRASRAGLDLGRLLAIFVTHEHGDHLNGVDPLARHLGLGVYASPAVIRLKGDTLGVMGIPLAAGETVRLGPFAVLALGSSHDTVDPLVYHVRAGGRSLGIATDMGEVSPGIRAAFRGLDALVLEFNHDPGLLAGGSYPPFLKARVGGMRGHLSNGQAADFLAEVTHPRLSLVVAAHLSKENNRPELALEAARGAVAKGGGGAAVHVAGQDNHTGPFVL